MTTTDNRSPEAPGTTLRDQVTTAAELDALPLESVVRFPGTWNQAWGQMMDATVAERKHNPGFNAGNPVQTDEPEFLWFVVDGDGEGKESGDLPRCPATILYRPDRPALTITITAEQVDRAAHEHLYQMVTTEPEKASPVRWEMARRVVRRTFRAMFPDAQIEEA